MSEDKIARETNEPNGQKILSKEELNNVSGGMKIKEKMCRKCGRYRPYGPGGLRYCPYCGPEMEP